MLRAGTAALIFILMSAAGHGADEYVGSKACAGCHPKLYAQYRGTPMGRSIEAANAPDVLATVATPVTVHSGKLDRYFEVFSKDSKLYQTEYAVANGVRVFENTYKLDYMAGSGQNGRTPLVGRGDFLVEAPLSYYAKANLWGLSPGFETADYGFNRPIHEACIRCHCGKPNAVAGRNGLYEKEPFQEMAIGCENCHGPGGAHVRARTHGVRIAGRDITIVNPRRLPPRLAEDICMMCHQGGDTRVLQPGKQYADFRPGNPLYKTLAILKVAPRERSAGDADLLEHHAAMKLSKCFRASGGKLSCLTCHDPHTAPAGEEAVAYYRQRCFQCHTEASCQVPFRQRGGNCIGCHMPKRAIAEISHSALTNHRIVARPGEPLPADYYSQSTPGLPGILYLNAPPGGPELPILTRFAAYGELQAKAPDLAKDYPKAFAAARTAFPNDPLVLAAVGRQALLEGRYPDAIQALQKSVSSGTPSSVWLLDLARALKLAGQEPDAVPVLQRAAALDPFDTTIQKTLILAYIDLHDYTHARAALQSYVASFPEDSLMRGLLHKVEPR
ncbi:MAG: cytochrome c3 family protein [Bryobacteraceae bacterium]